MTGSACNIYQNSVSVITYLVRIWSSYISIIGGDVRSVGCLNNLLPTAISLSLRIFSILKNEKTLFMHYVLRNEDKNSATD